MSELAQILDIVKRIETKVDTNHESIERILKIIHGVMQEILANLTEESGGDLVAALRKLTEAVNSLGSQVAASPSIIVSKLRDGIQHD